ncbi:MAG: fibronectin type III domain-containing protein [Verrucomicrobiota bacterium]|jgi:hypothetical protein
MLIGRLSFWWCAILMACGQVPACAQLFLVASPAATNAPASGLVALGWNPSPDTNATGYFLCWGLSSDACTNLLDAGDSTSATVAGLATNAAYYFSVVAYDSMGDESPPSNEISYSPPSAVITLLVTNLLLSADSEGQALMPDLTSTNYTLVIDTCSSSGVLTQSVAAGAVLALSTNPVVLTLTDGCGNAAYATNFVIVQDTTPRVIQSLTQTGGLLTLTWSALPWQTYQVQYTTNLNQPNWNILADAITTTNALATASDAIGPDLQRFYRVLIVP